MFTFDPVKHQYLVDDVVYPSITGLIKPLTHYDSVPEFMMQKAGQFGTNVHKLVQDYLTVGRVDMSTAEEMICFDGFRKFWDEHSAWHSTPLIVEKPMFHPKFKYAGTPDIILDGAAIIEIKTRLYNKRTDPLQLSAQEMIWIANGGVKMVYPKFVLELHKDGTYKLVPVVRGQFPERFRYLVDHYWKCREWEEKVACWRG